MGKETTAIFLPGLGVSYDFHTPADRSGWSIAPILVMASEIRNLDKNSYDYSEVISFIFPSVVGRYRYAFNKQFLVDFNLGGGLVVAYSMFVGSVASDEDPLKPWQVNMSKKPISAPFKMLSLRLPRPVRQ